MATAPSITSSFTADGTSAGVVTVADTSNYRPTCFAYLNSNNQPSLAVKIVSVLSSTTLLVGPVSTNTGSSPSYGGLDVSAYTVAHSATITQNQQGFYIAQQVNLGTNPQQDITSDGTNVVVDGNLVVKGTVTSTGGSSGLAHAKFDVGSVSTRGIIQVWDSTASAYKYLYVDNGVLTLSSTLPT